MSVNSVKISQIVLDGILYDVNVSYKDASGDLFPIENASNFTLFSEDQSKKLHAFILQSVAQIPKTKSLSNYSSIKIEDQGVFSEGNEKLVEMTETISSIWKQTKAELISHLENSTISVVIPLENQAAAHAGATRAEHDQEDEEVRIEMNVQPHSQDPSEEELAQDLLRDAGSVGTSLLSGYIPNSQRPSQPQLSSILQQPSIKQVLAKEKSNEGYYKEIIDAVFNEVITNRKQTLKDFIESLEEVAQELRKNESDNTIKKEISQKLSAQMIEKLKEIHVVGKDSFKNLKQLYTVYQGCAELKDASPTLSETSFTNIIQARRS